MADNEAARANFEELQGHIDLASKRIKALKPGTENYNQTLEDLEDYYERTVQLRKIQADTAIEERNEAQKSAKSLTSLLFLIIVVLVGAIVLQFSWLAPDTFAEVWDAVKPYATVDRAVMAISIMFIYGKRGIV